MTLVFTLFLRRRTAPCSTVAAASLVGSRAASWVGSRVVVVKPVAQLVSRQIEIHRMLVLAKPVAKPVARRIEQLHQTVVAVVNSSGGRQVDQSKQRPPGGDDDDRT